MEEGRRAGGASNGDEKEVLGPEHPATLTSMNNLVYTFKFQGRNDEATSLMGKCSQLWKQTPGSQHPPTDTT